MWSWDPLSIRVNLVRRAEKKKKVSAMRNRREEMETIILGLTEYPA